MMDFVGRPLADVVAQMDSLVIRYQVDVTSPTRNLFVLDEQVRYVIRQRLDAEGIWHLTAAAKMGKEVF